MKTWNRFPFVRLLIPLLAGIIVALLSSSLRLLPVWPAVAAFLVFIVLELFFYKKLRYRSRWVFGALIHAILIYAGYQLTILNTPLRDPLNIVYSTDANRLIVRVCDPVSERPNSYKILADVVYIIDSASIREAAGNVLLYFEKSDDVKNIRYGDELFVRSNIGFIDPPGNPGEFNYRRYLYNKGIYCRGYVKSGSWKIIGHGYGNPVKAMGINLRQVFLNILERNRIKGKEFAVVSAILLGYDEHLDPDQKRQFAGAGAMHILCVSGLHVGIIYVILNSLLVFLDRKRWTRLVKVFLMLIFIWFYAAVTGFSPSVLRASTMFSFIIIGRTMKRKANIFNMIAASAFFLLVYDPYILTEVGFQLSYLAVTGIVLMYKPIYNLVIPGNVLLNKIWQITAVSIAATLFTFPLSVFYFRQFPVLFLLTNLVAIPASMLIIYLGIAVLLTSFIPFLASILSWLLVWVIKILNFSVQWIESLPFATLRDLHVNSLEFAMLLFVIISIVVIVHTRKKLYLYVISCCLLILFSSLAIRNFYQLRQHKIAVYNIRRATGIDFIDGKKSVFLADAEIVNEPSKIEYHISGFRAGSGIKQIEMIQPGDSLLFNHTICKKGDFIQFDDKRLLLLHPGIHLFSADEKPTVDFVIFSHDPKVSIEELASIIKMGKIIFDASNSWYRVEEWKAKCRELNIDWYDVSASGAWVTSM